MNVIRDNVARIREEMAAAAVRAGRAPEEILLCAATKMNDTAAVREAIAAGVDCCGENRVQELLAKQPEGAYEGVPVHMIGHLQRNKVKQVVGRVSLIQSADTRELLETISKQAQAAGLTQNILLEINSGREPQKSGFLPEEAEEAAAFASSLPAICLRGLMTVPPVTMGAGTNRRYFAEMYQLFVDIKAKKYDNVIMDYLSMGMSQDFADAIAEGSTMIRIGTAIFGPRNYTK